MAHIRDANCGRRRSNVKEKYLIQMFRVLEDLALLVFREISMVSKQLLETIDRSFRLSFQTPVKRLEENRSSFLVNFGRFYHFLRMEIELSRSLLK